MITVEFEAVVDNVRQVASALGGSLGELLLEYAPSIIGSAGESVTVRVSRATVGHLWNEQLEGAVLEHVSSLQDEFGDPCQMRVVYE